MAEILIVGTGPTGLVLTSWLTCQGIRVRVIGKSTGPGEMSAAELP
jgi:2-polyprenyl-6-methoxyphenol hydroxylase-like FAD-dependent oxidoreductase